MLSPLLQVSFPSSYPNACSSCSFCRRRKIKCNREQPCSNCVRSRITANCVYDQFPHPLRARHDERRHISSDKQNHVFIEPAPENDRSSTLGVTIYPTPPTSNDSGSITLVPPHQFIQPNSDPTNDVESMKRRIKELEDQLSIATKSSVPSPAFTHTSQSPAASVVSNYETKTSLSGTFHIHKESRPFGQNHPVVVTYGVLHKTRLLGQSHWINGVTAVSHLSLPLSTIDDMELKSNSIMTFLKSLSHIYKKVRKPPLVYINAKA